MKTTNENYTEFEQIVNKLALLLVGVIIALVALVAIHAINNPSLITF